MYYSIVTVAMYNNINNKSFDLIHVGIKVNTFPCINVQNFLFKDNGID